MALSVVDIYKKIPPKTNCKDCGYSTCPVFASMVVSEKLPPDRCPHIPADVAVRYPPELQEQYRAGKWTKRDPAQDALAWARERAATMNLSDLPGRIGRRLIDTDDGQCLEPSEGFEAKDRLLFDETITGHLDIESILFLSEQLARRRMGETDNRA